MMTNDACLLFQGAYPHPAHESFGEAVDAEFRHFETGKAPDGTNQDQGSELSRIVTGARLDDHYDVVIAEGSAPLQTLLTYKLAHHSTTAVFLSADETFLTLPDRPTRHLWRVLGPVANRLLDGVVPVGRDVEQWGRRYLGKIPSEVVHPPVMNEKYERLSKLSANSPEDPFLVLSVGEAKPANNYETLVEATRGPTPSGDVKTVILGRGHPDAAYAQYEHVETPGYVDIDQFVDWFHRASLYVQPSTGDSFPVATLEGILSGTPTIVTTGVGVRELLPDSRICEPTLTDLREQIRRFEGMTSEERVTLAEHDRTTVEPLTEANQAEAFRSAVESFKSR